MIVATDATDNWDWYIYDNQAPSEPVITGDRVGTQGTPITFSFASTDANNDTIKYTIDWGDFQFQNISSYLSNGSAYTVTHTWYIPGEYTVTVYSEDVNYATSNTVTFTVLIDAVYVGTLGYLIDYNGTGTYDTFYSNSTRLETTPELQDGVYLLDTDNDGVSDYSYNPASKAVTSIGKDEGDKVCPSSTSTEFVWIIIAIVCVVIAIVAAIFFLSKGK